MCAEQKVGSGLDLGPTSLRERIVKHLSSDGVASNFEAMCTEIERTARSVQIECRDCDGLGFRTISEAELAAFKLKVARKQANGADWKTLDAERWRLNRDSVCATCRGTGHTKNHDVEMAAIPDSMWTTVTCERCRGKVKTLFGRRRGSSCGELFPPTDASAEYGDVCPSCLGDAYHVAITARPQGKSQEPAGYIEELEDVPIHLSHEQRDDVSAEIPSEVIRSVQDDDPVLAAGMVALLGPHGDRWAQHQWGRRFALWPLTAAGQQLVHESKENPSAASDWHGRKVAILEAERLGEVQAARGGSARRRALIGLADSQARTLEHRIERQLREIEAA